MIVRKFYTIEEARQLVGGSLNLLLEMVEFHGLRAYARFNHASASHMDERGFMEDSLGRHGSHELANWLYFPERKKPVDDLDIDLMEYKIDGWFELSQRDTNSLLKVGETSYPSVSSFVDGERFGYFFNVDAKLDKEEARFRVKDIEWLLGPESNEKPEANTVTKKLRSDREESLLRVIAGLWSLSKLPPEHNKTAGVISKLFEAWAWDGPKAGTIADKILNEAANLPGARVR